MIVIAADVMTVAPDFGHLEPMLDAARRELDPVGPAIRSQRASDKMRLVW